MIIPDGKKATSAEPGTGVATINFNASGAEPSHRGNPDELRLSRPCQASSTAFLIASSVNDIAHVEP